MYNPEPAEPRLAPPRDVLSVYEPRGAPSRARRITPGRGVITNNLRDALREAGRMRREERVRSGRVAPILLDGPFMEQLDEDHDEL